MPTIYVACNNSQTGDGSDSTPYGDLNYALEQEAVDLSTLEEPLTFAVRTGTSGGAFTTSVQINDADYPNADSSHYLIIQPDTGYEPEDGESQLSVTVDAAFGFAVEFAVDYTVWDGIDIVNTSNTSSTAARVYSGFDNIVIRNCIIQGSSNGSGQTINSDGNPLSIQNCLLLLGSFNISNFTTANVTECVIARASGNGISLGGSFGVLNLYNSIFWENNTDVANASGTINASNNATSQATGTNIGSSPVTEVPSSDFEDEENNDFRLVAGATDLIDAGTGTGLPSTVVAFDRFGTARPEGSARDIGYHEFADEGVSGSGTLSSQSATTTGTGTVLGDRTVYLTVANGTELRDENNDPVASLSDIVYEWYDDPDTTSGEPTDSGVFSTNANGEAEISISNSVLADGEQGGLILIHPSDPTIRGYYIIEITVEDSGD